MAPALAAMLFLAPFIFIGSSEVLQDTTCLDENLDETLLQMARLHKSIITSLTSTIEQHIADLRKELESKIKTLETHEKVQLTLWPYEKRIRALEKTQSDLQDEISNLKQELNKTDSRLVDLSKDTYSSLSSVNSKISSVNKTLSSKSADLTIAVEKVKVDLNSVQSDVDLLKKEGVRTGPDGKIDRAVLPGSYADFTLEDIAWGSLHMAATAACRGSVPSGGTGRWANAVVPAIAGYTCDKVCAEYYAPNAHVCDSAVTLMGYVKHTTKNLEKVGYYYNYGCGATHGSYIELNRSDNESLKRASYMTYCCCRYPL